MRATIHDVEGAEIRCDICHEVLTAAVLITDTTSTSTSEDGIEAMLTIVDCLAVPCAHHAQPYWTADGLPPNAECAEPT